MAAVDAVGGDYQIEARPEIGRSDLRLEVDPHSELFGSILQDPEKGVAGYR